MDCINCLCTAIALQLCDCVNLIEPSEGKESLTRGMRCAFVCYGTCNVMLLSFTANPVLRCTLPLVTFLQSRTLSSLDAIAL